MDLKKGGIFINSTISFLENPNGQICHFCKKPIFLVDVQIGQQRMQLFLRVNFLDGVLSEEVYCCLSDNCENHKNDITVDLSPEEKIKLAEIGLAHERARRNLRLAHKAGEITILS